MKNLWFAACILIIAACSTPKNETIQYGKFEDPLASTFDPALKPFYHGVASGDPLNDAVIIWTKVTPEDSIPTLTGQWEVATDQGFSTIIKSGDFSTGLESNYTVKIDVTGLKANTSYFYRFTYNDQYSPIGRTKTAPSGDVDSLKFVVISCSNYEAGFFNAYGRIGELTDIDVVIHLGDYIYEYGKGVYGDTTTGRFHQPPHEIISLLDYRTRYAQYRLDKDLQSAHQNHPFITIWDDHEIANDSYKDGAQNHQEGEGSYDVRRETARKVYYEWMPVRENPTLYRSFSYGDMADLIMMDERLEGRTAPVESVEAENIADDSRSMLGEKQLTWFKERLSTSDAKWKIIGNQVIFSYLNWGWPSFKINLDSWDGYPGERAKIIDFIKSNNVENIVFVTGDTHSSWALEVTDDPFGSYEKEGAIATEFGTTSINSSNSDERSSKEIVVEHEKKIVNSPINPQLKYANLRDHGYLELALFPDKARARWYYVGTVTQPVESISLGMEKYVPVGENVINDEL